MKNRNVGLLIVGIAVVIGIIVFLFNNALTSIVSSSCSHGSSCAMYGTIKTQTYIAMAIIAVIIIIGLILIFSKESEKIIVKRIKPTKEAEIKQRKLSKETISKLDNEEKKVMGLVIENNNSIYQSELVEKTGMNKVKVTRILDSLEAQGLIERRRRGMTNIVMLKNP